MMRNDRTALDQFRNYPYFRAGIAGSIHLQFSKNQSEKARLAFASGTGNTGVKVCFSIQSIATGFSLFTREQ
jgi:hypothetical protein